MKVVIIGLPKGFRQDERLQLGIQSDVERSAARYFNDKTVNVEIQILPRPRETVGGAAYNVVDVCYSGVPARIGDPTEWLLRILEDNFMAVADSHNGIEFSLNVPFYLMQ